MWDCCDSNDDECMVSRHKERQLQAKPPEKEPVTTRLLPALQATMRRYRETDKKLGWPSSFSDELDRRVTEEIMGFGTLEAFSRHCASSTPESASQSNRTPIVLTNTTSSSSEKENPPPKKKTKKQTQAPRTLPAELECERCNAPMGISQQYRSNEECQYHPVLTTLSSQT